jgi:hypothetical protein
MRLEPLAAALAVIEKLAGVSRHRLGGLMATLWARESRFQLHQRCVRIILSNGGSSRSHATAVPTNTVAIASARAVLRAPRLER